MISLMCLAATTIVGNIAASATIQNSDIPITDFLSNNFSTFVSKYNEYHEEELLATKLLRYRELSLENNETGYFFDFDYGYMVATDNYETLLISNNDLSYEDDLFQTDNVYFSGTAFYDAEGTEFGIDDSGLIVDNLITSSSYDGNDYSDVDGQIKYNKIDEYIASNYSDYEISEQKYIYFYDYITMFDTCVYVRKGDGYTATEGNCVLNATYSMLHNMGKKCRDREFYYSDYYVDYSGDALTHDAHYATRYNVDGWTSNDGEVSGTPNNGKDRITCLSHLYLQLRERAIASYGYAEEGMSSSHVKDMVMDIEGWYGYDTTFYQTNDFSTMAALIPYGIPSFVSTSNSINYHNHGMAVNGYIKLEKTSGWWIFTSTDTIWLLAVDDGWQDNYENATSTYRIFYDPNKQGGANFTCADKSTVDFSIC